MKKFKSKTDFISFSILWGIPVVVTLFLLYSFDTVKDAVIPIAIFWLLNSLTIWIYFSTYYKFTNDEIIVKSGPIRRNIPYQSISSVRKTKSLIASPALSILDRIEIVYSNGSVIISPKDKKDFVNMLKSKNPNISSDI
ncbi:PH domain-containing protein [Baia soyae]|uniref:PH (Pleckstrin Homology) domain-containing protein n=1 Tax=Baia soyae TaxID=1544746 RepID=A0A4R2RHE0_9BACL|nr:PH domain-containing protein [Baia soyae]TCP61547.1 PH (Pleckstrin Homology) domain-containing protein [Baia soyae]